MKLPDLRDFTSARVSIGRAGSSLPTGELLKLQLAHARARQAVHSKLDLAMLALELKEAGLESVFAHSAAVDRAAYLHRPDLGRQLNEESRRELALRRGSFDVCFVIADGLSALAVQQHAPGLLRVCFDMLPREAWSVAPIVVVEEGRVAVGDEVGQLLGAALCVVLIGERPGLSTSDSLGLYLTWNPHPGLTDADRNCISNIRSDGLSYQVAATKLMFLMSESRRRRLSGVQLKEAAGLLPPAL